MTDETDKLLSEREKTHGDAAETFEVGIDLVSIVVHTCSPLRPHHFAIINILHKIARILCGSYHEDHWNDIEGYARLGKRIQQENMNEGSN